MVIEYEVYESEKAIKIFGDKFVFNNINNFKIISKGKEFNLQEKIDIVNCDIYEDKIEAYKFYFKIELLGNINEKNEIDMSYMFHECDSLISILSSNN